jgi:hypothetical protein
MNIVLEHSFLQWFKIIAEAAFQRIFIFALRAEG